MGSCGATCGITKERANDLARARATAERVHPGLVWSRATVPDPRAVSHDALVSLASKLETLLPVRVYVREGDASGCDWLYVLAGFRTPCLAEIVDEVAPFPDDCVALRETYVRIAVSPHDRFAVLQEVVVSCESAEGELDEGVVVVTEPQAGVVDRRLQHIVKGLQGALRKARLVVLDLSAVLSPIPEAGASNELTAAFDEPPSLWSFLFEGGSPMATSACRVERARPHMMQEPPLAHRHAQ